MHFIFAILCLLLKQISVSCTALDDYVNKPDDNYGWTYLGPETDLHGRDLKGDHTWTGYVLNVTSQRWLSDADFSPDSQSGSIWYHFLVVIVPDDIKYTSNGTIWITGGSNNNNIPDAKSEDVALAASLAMGMGTITGSFFQIPNEHTTFSSDPLQKSRTEDAIVAFTWDHYLNDPSNPEWLIYFPMVKASVRALDAMTEFVDQQLPHLGCHLESYMVSGASKRGWTTWLVGAVDSTRVTALIPIVLDAVNFVAVEHHQWRSFGGWTWALQDYLDMGIMTRLDEPNMLTLQQLIDPFFYLDRLTMPKLVINAVMDEFQQPDDNYYWWDSLPEPKRLIMAPNTEHSTITGILEVVPAIGTWGAYLFREEAVPEFTWEISNTTGEIIATLDDLGDVYEASMWYAESCGSNSDGVERRDFRVVNADADCKCGILDIQYEGYCANLKSLWTREILTAEVVEGQRIYRASREAPSDGRFSAFLIDVKYKESALTQQHSFVSREHRGNKILPVDKPGRLEFTTQVSIWPDTFPYPDCAGEECSNTKVV